VCVIESSDAIRRRNGYTDDTAICDFAQVFALRSLVGWFWLIDSQNSLLITQGVRIVRLHIRREKSVRDASEVDCVWNVMAHAQKPDFLFRRNGRVHLNRRGRQFSRLLAAEVCAPALGMLDSPRSEVVWRVLATHSIRQFPLHFPSRASPCAIRFQTHSNNVWLLGRAAQRGTATPQPSRAMQLAAPGPQLDQSRAATNHSALPASLSRTSKRYIFARGRPDVQSRASSLYKSQSSSFPRATHCTISPAVAGCRPKRLHH